MLKSIPTFSQVTSFNSDIVTQHLYRLFIASMHVTCPTYLILVYLGEGCILNSCQRLVFLSNLFPDTCYIEGLSTYLT
jgi:hypothetical protein